MFSLTLLILALALSLDAFAVSISCGIKLGTFRPGKYTKIAVTFGLYQAVMPILGWGLGSIFQQSIGTYGKWISFAVFLFLGLKTWWDSWKSRREISLCSCNCENLSCLNSLAVATSIDAFLVGITLSLLDIPLFISVFTIGVITFFMVMMGCGIGNRASSWLKQFSYFLAGLLLIGLAVSSVY